MVLGRRLRGKQTIGICKSFMVEFNQKTNCEIFEELLSYCEINKGPMYVFTHFKHLETNYHLTAEFVSITFQYKKLAFRLTE